MKNQITLLLSIAYISAALLLSACAQVGGSELKLLTTSAVLDPLEVPPGLSPLPETSQFQLPSELHASARNVNEIPREQFRNYESWIAFEEYQKFYEQDKGIGKSVEDYLAERRSGEGIFRVVTVNTDHGTVRLSVQDNIQSVWSYLELVLFDMGLKIDESDQETWTYKVSNAPVEQMPNLLQRIGFREYSGAIEQIQLIRVGSSKVEVLGKTSQNVEVNLAAGEEFFKRLRFYLLTQYEGESQLAANRVPVVPKKQLEPYGQDQQKIVVLEDFDTTWEQVGRTLQASGMTIVDINRSKGVFYVAFHSIQEQEKKRWQFWKRKESVRVEEQFLVVVRGQGNRSEVHVELAPGGVAQVSDVAKVVEIVYERLVI